MNIITQALRHVTGVIDRRLLTDAFLDEDERDMRGTQLLEQSIYEKVIKQYVVPNLSTMGGIELEIDLSGIDYVSIDRWTRNYAIPVERRMGKNIVAAHYAGRSLHGGSTAIVPNYYDHYGRKTGLLHQGARMSANHQPIYQTQTADVTIVAPNVVEVRDFNTVATTFSLVVTLELSDQLEEIRQPYWSEFNLLVEQAVRRFIWTTLRVELNVSKLEAGRELDQYNAALEECADGKVAYEEELKKWPKYLILNDRRSQQAVYRHAGKYHN